MDSGDATFATLSARLTTATLGVARSAEDDGTARGLAYCAAVGALSEYLREAGAPPERVVILVKRLVVAAMRPMWARLERRDRVRIVDDGVRSCVAAYYGVRPLPTPRARVRDSELSSRHA
ncbi:MAG TPA: hypothetical protein VNW46_02180 [Gemmatimonadaceae bacterium]|nr:hypothetical protein [Gemmatimonadaceae bacterium]